MSINFYLDEDVDVTLEQALTNRGADAISTLKAGKIGNDDFRYE